MIEIIRITRPVSEILDPTRRAYRSIVIVDRAIAAFKLQPIKVTNKRDRLQNTHKIKHLTRP